MKPSLTVIVLTRNEQLHMQRCLDAISTLASAVFVVDSGSTDDTVQIARAMGAIVVHNDFINQATQMQWALDHLPIKTDWVMRLDADEVIEPDLCAQLKRTLASVPSSVVGMNLRRKHVFMGRWIKHGGRYPVILLRLWRKGHAVPENRWMDEHMLIQGQGKVITVAGGFSDHNLNDLTYFTEKHNRYATREAIAQLLQKFAPLQVQEANLPLQATLKRQMRSLIYERLPFALAALLYFVWRYVFQFGFLDGRPGLIYHFLQAFWYRFLVGAKLAELEAALAGVPRENVRSELQRLTGFKVENTV